MGKIQVITYIEREPEVVFDFVADLNTHPQYADVVHRAWITSEQKTGVGTTFKQVQTRGGQTTEGESEVIEWNRPTKITWRSRHRQDTAVVYEFQRQDKGTQVVHTVVYPQLDDPEKRRESIEENSRELENLKRLVEKLP